MFRAQPFKDWSITFPTFARNICWGQTSSLGWTRHSGWPGYIPIAPCHLIPIPTDIVRNCKVFTEPRVDLVVSGTDLSLEELLETLAFGMLKRDVFVFHQFGIFGTWAKLKPLIEPYFFLPFFNPFWAPWEYLLGRWVNASLFH